MTLSLSVQSARFANRLASLLFAGLLMAASLHAQQDRQLVQNGSQTPSNGKRLALVIGNGAYTSAPALRNPPNDAREMGATLRTLGFDVTSGINTNQRDMKRLIREFGQKLKAGGSGLFYYAGHGVQSKGRNYLVPVDADIQSEAEVEDSAVDVNLVLGYMDEAQNGLNIVILDACRNNPFARSFRSASGGLAQVDAPTGTLIAYATAPGRVASDGTGQNGLYTSELLKQMRVPGLSATEMFMRVRAEVLKQTGSKQVPWEASSLVGNFYFSSLTSNATKPLTTDPAKPEAVEISAEAHHRPKFENEFVRVWDVTLEAQDETLWHIHHYDDVVISFGNAKLQVETIGAAPVDSRWKSGEVRFNKAAYTHRAINIGMTPFHNLTIELLKPGGGPAGSPKQNEPAANAPILENDRVRIFRTILQPGQSTPMHSYRGPRLAIVVSSGEVDVTTEGKPTPDHIMRVAGEVLWRPAPLTFSLKNVGKTTFEIVDIELKSSEATVASSGRNPANLAACFTSNAAAGSTDWNNHYRWAQSQTPVKLKSAIQQKLDLVFNCTTVSDDETFDDFAAISVIVARYVPNAACFEGDAGVVSTEPSGHRNWARERGRAVALDNLKSKAAAALDCLDGTKRASFYADVSVVAAGGALK